MNQKEFELILQKGEGYKVEFKESVTSSLPKEMVAFANAGGGKIFIGVRDNGDVKGIKPRNTIKSRIQDMANNCETAVPLKISTHQNILILNIPEGQDRPYQCADGFYLRIGPNTQKMSRNQIIEFLQYEGKLRYEELLNRKFDFSRHYAPEKLDTYLRLAGITRTLDAVRETIVNALSHRDYFERGAHTVVEIFDDRLEVCNPGGLVKGLSLKDFGRKAIRRNQLIAGLLHRADYGENLGTGITRIKDLLRDNECPDIEFEITSFFTSRFKRYPYDVSKKEVSDEVPEVSDKEVSEVSEIKLNVTAMNILKFCAEAPKGRNAILEHLGYQSMTGNVRTSLKKLREYELLEYTLPDKPNSKKQEYMITDEGRQYLKKQSPK